MSVHKQLLSVTKDLVKFSRYILYAIKTTSTMNLLKLSNKQTKQYLST